MSESITVYKIGHIPWNDIRLVPQEQERAFEGIISLCATRRWERRYYQGERQENGQYPFFVFRAQEDALHYWRKSGRQLGLSEIWEAHTSQLIELPQSLSPLPKEWRRFWQDWLIYGKVQEDQCILPTLPGAYVCPDITLIKCVYPVPEEQEGKDSE